MDDIRIHREWEGDDLSRYTPEQLKILLDDKAERDRRKAGAWMLGTIGILIVAVTVSIPLIAKLYSWGFGG